MRILFSGHRWGDLTERLESNLPDCEIVHYPVEEIISNLSGINVIIPAMAKITKEIIDSAPDLKLIQQAGVGLEGVDIEAATSKNIPVANIPSLGSGNAESVAELAILHMMVLLRKYHQALDNFQKQVWGQPLGTTLYGKTVGIIGVGNIGKTLAKRLRSFEVKLLGVEPFATPELKQECGFDWLDKTNLDYLLENSDIVVICAAFNPQLKDMIGKPQFEKMKPSAFFVNVARGGFVNYEALATTLRENKIAGVGLDVFWEEPVDPTDAVFGYKVIATPHIGAATDTAYSGIARRVGENVKRLQRGEPVANCANAARIYPN
jgi:phosphoglycerate dehydrogenase-like enzyme